MANRLPTAPQIDAILAFLPRLEEPDQEFARSEMGDSAYTVWNAPLVDSLIDSLYQNGFVLQGFDWPNWEEGRQPAEDLDWINRADLKTICKFFTAHVRNDRFCGGHFAGMCNRGIVQAMIRRLAELR
jgi:hypothetical protein